MFLVSIIPTARIPLPSPQILTYFTTYRIPVGSLVLVDVRKKKFFGIVDNIKNLSNQKMILRKVNYKLRPISKIIFDKPILDEKQISLAKWISSYYWAPLGVVIKMMLPFKNQGSKMINLNRLEKFEQNILKSLESKSNNLKPKISQKLILLPEIHYINQLLSYNYFLQTDNNFNKNQSFLLNHSLHLSNLSQSDHLTQSKQIIPDEQPFYYPEIVTKSSLTSPLLKQISILHSQLATKQYYENWLKIKSGEAKIIIGTRLALFAPFLNLKEIVIEEEHNSHYKSQQTPRFQARETALKLAELWNAKLTLKSATPSLKTYWLAKNKKISLKMSTSDYCFKKPKQQTTPETYIIDLRQELKEGNFSIFSRKLQQQIKTALDKNQMIVLFINRRGASTALLCRDCGFVPKCPHCEIPLVYHLMPLSVKCHHCGHQELPPPLCPNCQGTRIKFFGAGTQKIETEFKKLFPNTKTIRLDSDVLSLSSRLSLLKPEERSQKAMSNFFLNKAQVIIGTQMVLNFLRSNCLDISLVAMMIADTLLYLSDFRSNERAFQTIKQLKSLTSKVFVVQTYSPENQAIKYGVKDEMRNFYSAELEVRQDLLYPPFSQLIKLTYRHKNNQKAETEAQTLTKKLRQQILLTPQLVSSVTILGPFSSFHTKIKNKYIWQIVLKIKDIDLKLRNKILSIVPLDWTIDIDPFQIL